jgi:hypothetical protein
MLEFGEGPNLEWTCKHCNKKKPEDLNPYTIKLLNQRMLKKAGYPLEANDLLYEEWLDLGKVCTALDTGCPFMGGKEQSAKSKAQSEAK